MASDDGAVSPPPDCSTSTEVTASWKPADRLMWVESRSFWPALQRPSASGAFSQVTVSSTVQSGDQTSRQLRVKAALRTATLPAAGPLQTRNIRLQAAAVIPPILQRCLPGRKSLISSSARGRHSTNGISNSKRPCISRLITLCSTSLTCWPVSAPSANHFQYDEYVHLGTNAIL